METNIKELRKAAGITQEQLAKDLGLRSASTVCMWENGTRRPTVGHLVLLAGVLDCSIDLLLKRERSR